MKNISNGECFTPDELLFCEDLVIDFKHSNEFCAVLVDNFLVRDVVGIAVSNSVRIVRGFTFGRPILQVIQRQGGQMLGTPNMPLAPRFRMLSSQQGGAAFLFLDISSRDI